MYRSQLPPPPIFNSLSAFVYLLVSQVITRWKQIYAWGTIRLQVKYDNLYISLKYIHVLLLCNYGIHWHIDTLTHIVRLGNKSIIIYMALQVWKQGFKAEIRRKNIFESLENSSDPTMRSMTLQWFERDPLLLEIPFASLGPCKYCLVCLM